VTEDYCVSHQSKTERNSPLVGSFSLDSAVDPIPMPAGIQLTSLVSTAVDGHTVIIATTSTGQIVKVYAFFLFKKKNSVVR